MLMKPRSTASAFLVSLCFATGCADQEEAWNGVVEIDYSQRALEQRVKRRLDLLRAGVRLRAELAVDKVWRSAMDYTFIARRPDEKEAGIAAVRVKRNGVPVAARRRGMRRGGGGTYKIEEGYWIVDVFSSVDTYLTSAVVARDMSTRRILQHLGMARRLSASMDRMFMIPEEQVYWRELFPIVVQNKGFGPLYVSRQKQESERDESAERDSLKVMGKRYQLEEAGDYVLVGQDRGDESCRHIFDIGGEYLASVAQYGMPEFDAPQTLQMLGLSAPDSPHW